MCAVALPFYRSPSRAQAVSQALCIDSCHQELDHFVKCIVIGATLAMLRLGMEDIGHLTTQEMATRCVAMLSFVGIVYILIHCS
jgi:hypothetical protein